MSTEAFRGMITSLDFHNGDVEYLREHFTPAQLKAEERSADMSASAANTLGDEKGRAYWVAFRDLARRAIGGSHSPKPVGSGRSIDAVKRQTDIVDLIGGYTKLRKTGSRFRGCCPIHHEKEPSLVVYPDQQSWHCFGCNRGGDALDFVAAVDGVSIKEALAVLSGVGP